MAEAGQPWWQILADYPTAGQPLDIVYDNDTPLSALRKLADAAGGLEFSVEGNSESYTVVLQDQVGCGTQPVVALAKRSLLSFSYAENTTDQANRIYPTGPAGAGQTWVRDMAGRAEEVEIRASVGDAEWQFTGDMPVRTYVAGTPEVPAHDRLEIKLTDPAGGLSPVAYDDQFVVRNAASADDAYQLMWVSVERAHSIVASSAERGTVTVKVGPGVDIPYQVFHRARIMRRIPAGTLKIREPALYLDHPASIARHGILVGHLEVPNVPPTNNLIRNPILREWGASVDEPVGWYTRNTPHAEITDFSRATDVGEWVSGGSSLLVSFTAPTQHIRTGWVILPYGYRGLLSFFVRLKVAEGSVRVVLDVRAAVLDPATGEVVGSSNPVLIP